MQTQRKQCISLLFLRDCQKPLLPSGNRDNPVIGNVRRGLCLTQDVIGLTSHEEKLWNSVHTCTWWNLVGTMYHFTCKSSKSIQWFFHDPAQGGSENWKPSVAPEYLAAKAHSGLKNDAWVTIGLPYKKIHSSKMLLSDKNASTWSWNSIARATQNPTAWTSSWVCWLSWELPISPLSLPCKWNFASATFYTLELMCGWGKKAGLHQSSLVFHVLSPYHSSTYSYWTPRLQ